MKIIKMSESSSPAIDIKDPKVFGFFKQVINSNRMTWRVDTDWHWRSSHFTSLNVIIAQRSYVGIISTGTVITKVVPTYKIVISVHASDKDFSFYNRCAIALYFNKKGSPTFDNAELIAQWVIKDDRLIRNDLNGILIPEFRLSILKMPHDLVREKAKSMEGKISKFIRLTKRKNRLGPATELIIKIDPKPKTGHVVSYIITNLETMVKDPPEIIIERKDSGEELTASDALREFDRAVADAKERRGFVDASEKYEYIQEGSNAANFDFISNATKPHKPVVSLPFSEEEEFFNTESSNKKRYILGNNFEGFFTGTVPDYATQFLGTTSVEASQIASMFGKANDAITLVNQFDSSLLYNISFIFNFAKGGAYGVYLSELDRAIKTKALQNKLEQKGYKVVVTEQGLTAYPKERTEISPDTIQQDIDSIYADLQSKGGAAIGINMNAVLNAARQDAIESGSKDSEVWQWMAVLHLGGTIVHEAIHAKGNMDEGPSEQSEQSFTQWALPKINDAYKNSLEGQGRGDEFTPLTITDKQRHAKAGTWYKTAQMSYYCPQSFTERPLGSDLEGRFPSGLHNEMDMQDWSMMAQQDQNIPIETRLGRQFMSPIPNDLSQEHDSIEEQLRKYTRDNWKLDPNASMEELLSSGWDVDRGYITTEGLLDEKRPKPLLVPLQKEASSLVKTATLFGWMNNLSISDGNTIPGLGDRVMAWEDRDECFSEEEEWIKQQPRYNPTYDIKGFFYRWIEPRYQPQLFEDMTRDYSNTHPAKRFASSIQLGSEVTNILSILSKAKSKIAKGDICTTRFIATEDVMPLIDRLFPDKTFKINVFHYGTTDNQGEIYAVWVSAPNVDEESLDKVEKHLQGKTIEKDVDKLLNGLMGISKQREVTLNEIIEVVKDICHSYESNDFSITGSYPRDIAMKSSLYLIDSLEFRGGWADQCLKIGGLTAEKLGAKNVSVSHNNLSFVYNNVSVSFSGDSIPIEVKSGLQEQGVDINSPYVDLFNRDFTVNMLVYDLTNNKIIDPTGKATEDIQSKTIRTFFNPEYVCEQNPIIILRALKLKIRHGMEIDPLLQKAMMQNISLLFDGRYSERDLIIARENVRKEGKKEAQELFAEFGLESLDKI